MTTMIRTFHELLTEIRGPSYKTPKRLLSIDPGETTGWALFVDGRLFDKGQISHRDLQEMSSAVHELFTIHSPTSVVVEDYKVYGAKAKTHSWSSLFTPKLLGAIEFICNFRKVPLVMQMASSKQFCTDEKLKQWKYYGKAQPHANDAIRHGCYFLLFHKRRRKAK